MKEKSPLFFQVLERNIRNQTGWVCPQVEFEDHLSGWLIVTKIIVQVQVRADSLTMGQSVIRHKHLGGVHLVTGIAQRRGIVYETRSCLPPKRPNVHPANRIIEDSLEIPIPHPGCGIHGANRLASNSLLDGLVFGHEAGKQALRLAADPRPSFPERRIVPLRGKDTFPLDVGDVRASLRSLTGRAAGILRDGHTMKSAVRMLDFWQNYVYTEAFHTVAGFELQNMLICAQLILHAALKREESRGAHQRLDFPRSNDHRWLGHIELRRTDFD